MISAFPLPVRSCVVTESYYTKGEDFKIADAVFDCIGEAGDERFSLSDLTTPGLLVSSAAAATFAVTAALAAAAAVCHMHTPAGLLLKLVCTPLPVTAWRTVGKARHVALSGCVVTLCVL